MDNRETYGYTRYIFLLHQKNHLVDIIFSLNEGEVSSFY